MRMDSQYSFLIVAMLAGVTCLFTGCATWPMLPLDSVADPMGAMGGAGVIYTPASTIGNLSPEQLAVATPAQLTEHYAPIIVQQRQIPGEDKFQWSPDDDSIGAPFLIVSPKGKLKTQIDTRSPTVYVRQERRRLGEREHLQITYTVWYPRHPRTKTVDIEPGEIDSGIIRVTLDDANQPILYETVLACGCYHKVFVEQWVEEAARQHFGPPESGKNYSVEHKIPFAFDWEVAGTVTNSPNSPVRPAVFVSAGEHKVKGFHSSAGFQWPSEGLTVPYRLAPYNELLAVPVSGETENQDQRVASIFNSGNDHQVWGADRMEKYIFMFIGTDDAGHPRRDDEILLHFDQSHWKDPENYQKHLRLAPGTL